MLITQAHSSPFGRVCGFRIPIAEKPHPILSKVECALPAHHDCMRRGWGYIRFPTERFRGRLCQVSGHGVGSNPLLLVSHAS